MLARKQQFLATVAELLLSQSKVIGDEPIFQDMQLTQQEIKTWLRFGAARMGCRWIATRESYGTVKRSIPGYIEKLLT